MEIKVRTLDEARAERVTIAVAPGQRAVIEIVDSEESSEEAAHILDVAERAGKVPALVARIRELEADQDRVRQTTQDLQRQLATAQEARGIETKRADGLARNLAETERAWRVQVSRTGEYDRDRQTERARADQNKGWAERTERHLADAVHAGDKARADLAAAQLRIDELEAQVSYLKAAVSNGQAAWQIQKDQSKRRALKLRAVGKLVHQRNVDAYLEDHLELGNLVRQVRQALIGPPAPPTEA